MDNIIIASKFINYSYTYPNNSFLTAIIGLVGVLIGGLIALYLDFKKTRSSNKSICNLVSAQLIHSNQILENAEQLLEELKILTGDKIPFAENFVAWLRVDGYSPDFIKNTIRYSGLDPKYYNELYNFFYSYDSLMVMLNPSISGRLPMFMEYHRDIDKVLALQCQVRTESFVNYIV